MRYRLRRGRDFAFQNFAASLDRAEKNLPELTSPVVPHYSQWYEAEGMQDLADKLEFVSEAEGDDEVLDEAGNVVGTILEEFCHPVLDSGGTLFSGPKVRALGDPTDVDSDTYAEKMTHDIFKKKN